MTGPSRSLSSRELLEEEEEEEEEELQSEAQK
jgi:hypothetical protein